MSRRYYTSAPGLAYNRTDRLDPPLFTTISYSSFSRLMAYEAARILHTVGCHVRTYDPLGLPVKDDTQHDHPKVQELRQLSEWSDGQFWCSPEQHGNVTAVFKNQSEYDALLLLSRGCGNGAWLI
jgi:NAD(P)H-dependent FMN reductase